MKSKNISGLSKLKEKNLTQGMSTTDLPGRINPTATRELKKNPVDYEKSPKFAKLKKMMGT